MSRTVRALPCNNGWGSLKSIDRAPFPTLRRSGRTIWPIYHHERIQESSGCCRWVSHIIGLETETEEAVAKQLMENILYFCKKNKTCRRQRKNAARLAKRIDRHHRRQKLKRELLKLIYEEGLAGCSVEDGLE
jgi:hypothetical protein